jgi:hypothetical protein
VLEAALDKVHKEKEYEWGIFKTEVKVHSPESISEYAERKLWKPLGACNDALWNLDREDGDEKTYCCFNTTARDLARLGRLILNKGNWNGRQLISETYLNEAITPAGYLENEFEYCHIVTTTTHKTLRGPRGGMILLPKDFPNPWGLKTPKGEIKMMSQVINFSVFPGQQGGPLEHVIAAKAVAFEEALSDSYTEYAKQVQKNAKVMAQAFMDKGYKVVSGGTDNHCMLIDLRTKFPELTGKKAENTLVKADITINKNMVPFDSRSPFQTSGIRVGTPAITTRGLKEEDMKVIVDMIDRILSNIDDENVIAEVKKEVNAMMNPRPMFAW